MHLSSVIVKNFRNLASVSIALKPGLNVLVGRNNTGKTNIFNALRLAIGQSPSLGEPLWLTRDDFFKESAEAPRQTRISVDMQFEDLSEKDRVKFFEIVEFNADEPEKSIASLHFEAEWPDNKRRPTIKRWGGASSADKAAVPSEILEALPITFLPALRDAEAALTPGYKSRLALLFRDLAVADATEKEAIEEIFETANVALEGRPLITGVRDELQESTRGMAGSDYAKSTISAAEPEFDRILRTLQIQMDSGPIRDLHSNGLGYNNLLYMATVLAHLGKVEDEDCPLLLVEEPEAHLHPQLIVLLGQYLAKQKPAAKAPQTIVSTHSPTLAANVSPGILSLIFKDPTTGGITCNAMSAAALDAREERELSRMLDVTRAGLYFSRGIIFVEGISEALLVPVLARWLGYDLEAQHIAVIPICGVAFGVFRKLISPAVLGVPAVIITDGDPPVVRGASWDADVPSATAGIFDISDRTASLLTEFEGHPSVKVFQSQVTLEYDLALAGAQNPEIIAAVWESCFTRRPQTLNREIVSRLGSLPEKSMAVWRGICRASHTGSKAEFAQRLSQEIAPSADCWTQFTVPAYIKEAVESVISRSKA